MIVFPALSSAPHLRQLAECFSVAPGLAQSLSELDEAALAAALAAMLPECDKLTLARECLLAKNQSLRAWQSLMVP